MRVEPLARRAAGAVVHGVDLRASAMTPALWADVRAAFEAFSWLHFPGQGALQPSDQLHFATQFPHDAAYVRSQESAVRSPFALVTLPEHPLVMAQGNVKLQNHYGLTAQLRAADLAVESGLEWHTDNIDSPNQSVLTCLHCLAAPQAGGQTLFAPGRVIVDALTTQQRDTAANLIARYTRWEVTNGVRESRGLPKMQALMEPDGTRLSRTAPHPEPGEVVTAEHPLLREHHGRPSLVASPSVLHSLRRLDTGEELGIEESRDTLAELLRPGTALTEEAAGDTRGGGAWEHWWEPGSLVAWDNRFMLHSTTSPLDWVGDRLMHRIRLPVSE